MPAGSVPCPDCGQPVPADRVSCPNCGALMSDAAAAAASARPVDAAVTAADGPLDRLELDRAAPAPAPEDEEEAAATDAGPPPPPSDARPAGPPPAEPLPGAYVPPSLIQRPMPAPPPVQMPLATSPSVGAPPPATAGWTPPSPIAPPAPPAQAGRASLFADLPFDAPDSVTEWMVAIGSTAATISFLLPWITGTTNYLTSWGLGSASRLPILALLIATAVLGILPNRVALWVRAGVLGLIGGSVFLGNIWPIVAGDFGDAAFGAVVGAAAAIVLIVGGILAVAPRRPGADEA